METALSIHHQDPRKRGLALAEHEKCSNELPLSMYKDFCDALGDDYEHCRSLAIKLVLSLSLRFSEEWVAHSGYMERARLEDDAFSRICRMINDPAVQVRIEAAKSISKFKSPSLPFLLATLDKKDEMIHSGTFVFGLEDERKDVRLASLESLCQCAKNNSRFADRCIDHIVDMFNDEIEGIRLKAIQCLQEINNAVLREDQVDVILTVLDSPSMDIREATHRMLANVNGMSVSPRSLRRCIESVLYNLARYPQDKSSIFSCFKSLGQNNADSIGSLVNELLAVHPYLNLPEQSLIDENYMAVLILIFNAAHKNPLILEELEEHTAQHRTYIRHTLPNYMPTIEVNQSQQAPTKFFESIFRRISKNFEDDNTHKSNLIMMEMSVHDLKSFGMVEPEFRGTTEFYRIVIESVLILSRLLSEPDWLESSCSLIKIRCVLEQTFSLLRRFHKLSPIQRCCAYQLRVQALAIELVIFVNSCNSSALDLCDDFLEEVRDLRFFLENMPLHVCMSLSSLTVDIMSELKELESPKPGTVARKLEPLFCKTPAVLNQINETLLRLIDQIKEGDLSCLKTSSVEFHSPPDNSDITHKFTAGLVLALIFDAMIDNITDTDDIRLKVVYPDQIAHIIVPMKSHFRLVSTDSQSGTSNYRLYTILNICHQTWSEASNVYISIILDYRDNPSTSITIDKHDQVRSSEVSQIIEISPIMTLKIHPQNNRWLS